jgi:hypothetical protein
MSADSPEIGPEQHQDSAEDYRKTLHTVGLTLIVVGLIDIGVMVYCIATRQSYLSSFNLFAVIAGIYLRRGNLRLARWVAFFSAFYLSGFAGAVVVAAVYVPIGLILTTLRLHPVIIGWLPLLVSFLWFLAWVYGRLTSPQVLAAMETEGIDHQRWSRRPSSGFAVGGALCALLLIGLGLTLRGGAATRAAAQARQEMGPGYRYFVARVSTDPSGTRVTVVAYNRRELREVEVRWGE